MQPDEDILGKANRYESLAAHSAFREIMEYLRNEAESAKGVALTTPHNMPTEEVRRLIIKWQERESVVLAIQHIFDEQTENKRILEEQAEYERNIARERTGRAAW